MTNKRLLAITCVSAMILSACGESSVASREESTAQKNVTETSGSSAVVVEPTDLAEESRVEIKGDFVIDTDVEDGYSLSGETYTITKGGEYLLSGKLYGNIVVNIPEDEKVELMLAGVSITSDTSAPIYIVNGKSVTITAKGGTFNEITDSRGSLADDVTEKAAIYSCIDLNLKGQGTLIVNASANNGIHTKKDLEIKNLTLKVDAANHAVKGNNSIDIESGCLNLKSTDGHGLKTSDSDVSHSGKQKGNITISGGDISIVSGKDGINSANDVYVQGEAKLSIEAKDDGIHASENLSIDDGIINIITAYEGLEGHFININGGSTYVYATDDGVNACGSSSSEMDSLGRKNFGGGSMQATDACITVTGGYLDVTTPSGDTDAIDSNGNYIQMGGFVLVKGGASSGNVAGSIDVNGSINITGGTCAALGGICETPVDSCNTYVMSGTTFGAGDYIITDSSENTIISFTLNTNYTNAWICSEYLKEGETYILKNGDTQMATWTQEAGIQGEVNNGGFGPGGAGPGGAVQGGFDHGGKPGRGEGHGPMQFDGDII